MEEFATRTGLSSNMRQVRYLWTDAFAVCNYLTLFRRTGLQRHRERAVALIDRVHHALGRHRDDSRRRGWISGLDEEEGERHPTARGLRIGKPLSERGPGDRYDPRQEWNRDGQYYHYLMRWTHALARAAEVLEDPKLHQWAVELAKAAHAGFTYRSAPGSAPRMYWKMSIDLTRPLVPSQGAHDPLDGLVTSSGLGPDELRQEVNELWRMCNPAAWATDDPLGVGGLLTDTWRVAQLLLASRAQGRGRLEELLLQLVESSLESLDGLTRSRTLVRRFEDRLAFRELGLAIGLRASEELLGAVEALPTQVRTDALRGVAHYVSLAHEITATWLSTEARTSALWKAHEDINDVMLATALAPDEFIRA